MEESLILSSTLSVSIGSPPFSAWCDEWQANQLLEVVFPLLSLSASSSFISLYSSIRIVFASPLWSWGVPVPLQLASFDYEQEVFVGPKNLPDSLLYFLTSLSWGRLCGRQEGKVHHISSHLNGLRSVCPVKVIVSHVWSKMKMTWTLMQSTPFYNPFNWLIDVRHPPRGWAYNPDRVLGNVVS